MIDNVLRLIEGAIQRKFPDLTDIRASVNKEGGLTIECAGDDPAIMEDINEFLNELKKKRVADLTPPPTS